MSVRTWCVLAVGVGIIATAAPVGAHHSFSAEYDRDKPLTVTGTVTKLEWTNPHARLYVDVAGEDGSVAHWDFELGPPNGLMRRGWRRDSLQPGHVVTISGFHSKFDAHVGNARSVTLADGRQVFAGSSFDTGQTP
jgi:hypothetical protein